VLDQAGLCVLDTVACIVAGAATPEGAAMLAAEEAAGTGGAVTVLGSTTRLSAEAAARLHAYWGDIFELNDLIGGHAGIGIVPAVLAVAEQLGSPGKDVLVATVAGIEVASRIYDAVYPTLKPYTEAGLVTPGLVNSFGAAAAVARLRGSTVETTAQAMAIAGAIAAWCPAEVIFGSGGTIKPALFGGAPAAAGIRAVTYAEHGITGPSHLLESRLGLFPTLSRADAWDVDSAPANWRLERPRRKLHACCGYIHAAIDGVVALRRQRGPRRFDGARIEIRMPEYVIPAVSKRRPPATANEARFHLQYCVALAMSGADVIIPEHSTAFAEHLSQVGALLPDVEVTGDETLAHYHQCEVAVRRPGEESVVLRFDGPRGTPQNPLSDDEVRAKAVRLLRGRVRGDAADLVGRFGSLASEPGLAWLHESIAPVPVTV
jgi:2-methylcitrate dehydratase PrpD